ncbi:Enoyl-CoA hydratase domain-containing protein 3, mitochondrial [Papilio machaon]|uniref:Enoyl-CoA hydratase domain-containing protein 3, mitochondrial n=1 Tax=Papilio machaon TaxID=76193 RepID=A0A194RMT8_PAPMA|nr:Enoyl-CoA hydratase domain-containing protein 3, mitochondrial [Papilio machaon]
MFLAFRKQLFTPLTIRIRNTHNEYIITNENDGTREIILNHEKTKNSLSINMMSNLIQAINANKEDTSLRAIVLSAKGNVFSAGHQNQSSQSGDYPEQTRRTFVTQIHNVANFGIFCSTPGIPLARSVPKSRAMYMLLTGQPINAKEAYESGLVTKVVPPENLDEEVTKIIDQIKLKSRSVITLGKYFFYKQINFNIFDAYKLGQEIMINNTEMDDGQEGIRSFVEKRKAKWSHK